jgi:hypothetical protein
MASQSRAEAGRWLVIIFIYMLAITFIMTCFNYFAQAYSVTYSASVSGGYAGSHAYVTNESCMLPSDASGYYTNDIIPKDTIVSRTLVGYDECDSLTFWKTGDSFVNVEEACNSINGCNYMNVTSFNWFWSIFNASAYCNGTIDYNSYGIDTTNWTSKNKTEGFCTNDGIYNNANNCLTFGCVWVNPNTKQIKSTSGFFTMILGTIWDMVSFNLDIGLSGIFLALFTALFVYLPLIMVGVCAYIMVVG